MNQIIKSFYNKEPDHKTEDLRTYCDLSLLTLSPAVYIIYSPDIWYQYPNGKSRVLYIGKSEVLKSRIRTHYRHVQEVISHPIAIRNSQWFYGRYQYIARFGGKVLAYKARSGHSKNLESTIIEAFYDRYHSLPVGNGAFSFKRK